MLVGTVGILGLNMPVILAAFADHEFGTGVGGYSLFNSLTAIGALTGAILSARRTDVLRLRTLVSTLSGLGVILALASIAPTDLAVRRHADRQRAAHPALPDRSELAGPDPLGLRRYVAA